MGGTDEAKRVIVAGAGTGKTTLLRNIAVERCIDKNVLYLTYTQANACEFEAAITQKIGYLPTNITVLTWFSFLLVHGVRPFPAPDLTNRINGLFFNNQEPRNGKGVKRGMEDYYCRERGVVYRSRLADLAVYCNGQWGGEVVKRICGIYDVVLVDEGQDFAGYDYDFLLSLLDSAKEMIVVGDPRQQTYRTAWKAKNNSYSDLFDYLEKRSNYQIDGSSLSVTHRCSKDIIDYANRLYPEYPQVSASDNLCGTSSGGVACIDKDSFGDWIASRIQSTTVLTWNSRVSVPYGCRRMNMGESKGLTLGDVAVFVTGEMSKWLKDESYALKPEARAKLYVAITRASGDLCFVL